MQTWKWLSWRKFYSQIPRKRKYVTSQMGPCREAPGSVGRGWPQAFIGVLWEGMRGGYVSWVSWGLDCLNNFSRICAIEMALSVQHLTLELFRAGRILAWCESLIKGMLGDVGPGLVVCISKVYSQGSSLPPYQWALEEADSPRSRPLLPVNQKYRKFYSIIKIEIFYKSDHVWIL